MRTVHQLLRELARPDVAEFAVASDRLPCIKIGDRYEPVDDSARSTDAILEMLVTVGGSRHVEDLEQKPAQWTTRVDGVGIVGVHAVMRAGRVQARFAIVRRASRPSMMAAKRRSGPPVSAMTHVSVRPSAVPPGSPPLELAPADISEPLLRAAVVQPTTRRSIPTGRATVESSSPTNAPAALRSAVPTVQGSTAPSAHAGVTPAVQAAVVPAARAAVVPAVPRASIHERGRNASLLNLLSIARDAKASDLHVVAGRPLLLRLGGELVVHGELLSAETVGELILASVPTRLRGDLETNGSCDFAYDAPPLGRFRVNVVRQRSGLKGCFRCIPPDVPTLESLGLPPEIERATRHHQGLVLVTGPTGHGKTSTLAAIVDIINRNTTHHIITVEDPVEYVHPRKKAMVSQREVGAHTLSFANALKASLREDPDVIVVGELRDTETVRMALSASETGHLVLGTMNTPSVAKTIDRVVDLFPAGDQAQVRMTLAGGLHLVIGQRLLPAVDGQGLVVATELLPGSIPLWNLIRDAKTYQIPSLQQRGKGFGIHRLDESLADLVRTRRVSRDAALAVAEHPEELDAVLSGARPPAPTPETAKRADKPEPAGLMSKAGQIFGKRGS